MDKVQDGFVALRDSTKPVVIAGSDRSGSAFISFVGNRVLITPTRENSGLRITLADQNSLEFEIVPIDEAGLRLRESPPLPDPLVDQSSL